MRLGSCISLIMTHSILPNMAHRRAKGYVWSKRAEFFVLSLFVSYHGTYFPNNIWFTACLLVCAHTKTWDDGMTFLVLYMPTSFFQSWNAHNRVISYISVWVMLLLTFISHRLMWCILSGFSYQLFKKIKGEPLKIRHINQWPV